MLSDSPKPEKLNTMNKIYTLTFLILLFSCTNSEKDLDKEKKKIIKAQKASIFKKPFSSKLINFFMGQIMRVSKGRFSPSDITQILKNKFNNNDA